MTVTIKQRKTDVDLEKQILIHAITSTKFLKETSQALQADHLQIPYAKRVYTWILDYFKKYGEAPKAYIQDIYNVEKENLQEAEGELIADFLEGCSQAYAEGEEEKGTDYFVDKTIEYAKKNELLAVAERIKSHVNLGRIGDAENLIVKYNKIGKITSKWVNPNEEEFVKKVFEEKNDDILIKFPGALGELIGPMQRSWLISSCGVAKIGKSFFLHEIRQLGLWNRLNVIEINLEMSSKQLAERYYQRISAFGREDGPYIYPVFDCVKNQSGTCKKSERMSSTSVNDEYGMRLEFGDPRVKNHKVCTTCRETSEFELTTWFENGTTEAMTYENVIKKTKAQTRMFGDNYRLITYPKFSASLRDIENDIDLLAATEGFVPDICIFDYADAAKATQPGRDGIDETWQGLARMAAERRMLVATTSHTNIRRVEGKRSSEASDVSGDTRKLNHVDLMFSHSQSKIEKEAGIIRCAVVEHRHKYFNEMDEVYVTRALNQGQSLLDSETVPRGSNNFGGDK